MRCVILKSLEDVAMLNPTKCCILSVLAQIESVPYTSRAEHQFPETGPPKAI